MIFNSFRLEIKTEKIQKIIKMMERKRGTDASIVISLFLSITIYS